MQPEALLPADVPPEQLASELAGMMRTGLTVKACRNAPGLSSLTLVRAKSASDSPDDRAVAAANLVREACARVDDMETGNAAVLLGIAPGFRSTQAKARRRQVADDLAVTLDHLRTYRELQMLEAIGDELYAMDSAYRLRHRHRTEIEDNVTKTTLKVDWLQQHRGYRRIWTPVTALRADTLMLAGYLRGSDADGQPLLPRTATNVEALGADSPRLMTGDDWHAVNDRCMNLCWRLAQFSSELNAYVEREGGLWILADAEAELRAADAMYRLGIHLPVGEADLSVLRLFYAGAPHKELDPFETAMLEDERWPIFRDLWIEWVAEYLEADGGAAFESEAHPAVRSDDSGPSGIERVTTGSEQSACGRWLRAGEDFIQLIDADWYRVADWYR